MTGDILSDQDNGRSKSKILLILAVLATLTAVAVAGGGKLKRVLVLNKMTGNVALLNNAVRAYRGDGGKFSSTDTLESVMLTLKSVDRSKSSPGFAGLHLDKRFVWTMQTSVQAATNSPRTTWNNESTRFEIVTAGGPGVASFSLDNTSTEPSNSGATFEYAEKSGWSWNYEDDVKKTPAVEPTKVDIEGRADAIDSTDWLPVSLPSIDAVEDYSKDLQPPVFSVPEGAYPAGEFDLKVSISNPNPKETSSISWSINYGPWKSSEGEPVSVEVGDTLVAIVKSLDSKLATDSRSTSATYDASPDAEIAETPSEPKSATLSFGAPGVDFEGTGNHYFLEFDGNDAKMGLLVSDSSTLRTAMKNRDVANNGDTCAFWVSDGLEAESTTIAMDLNENPALAINFMVYNVDVILGGDKLTIEARTGKGSILSNPEFTFQANDPDGVTYNPNLGEADVKVNFTPPEGDAITEITLKWEASDPSIRKSQSIGLGEISFNYL